MSCRTAVLMAVVAVALVGPATAQVQAVLFTGNHPFVSRDAPNERPGGAITQLSEFDLAIVLPVSGGSIARPLLPATAMQCYLGDANFDGDYLKFDGWRATYDQALGVGGVFVRDADRASVSWDKVYRSVRFGPGVVSDEFEIFVGGGIPYLMEPSDWARLLPDGDSRWFLAPGHLQSAVGPQPGGAVVGAAALLQAPNGDLYYSPSDGGHWVSGAAGPPQFAAAGAICKIDAAAISYDGDGNVAGIVPSSARLLVDVANGALSVQSWVQHAGAMDRTGAPLQAGDYGLTVGLAFDPAGGSFQAAFPDAGGVFTSEPHLIFASESPEYGGTLFSTRNGGEVAVINGVACGSVTPGVAADGAWLGVELDVANDQPSLLGFTLVDVPPLPQPLLADTDDFGALPVAAARPTWQVDFHGTAGAPLLAMIALGPVQVGGFPDSFASASVPLAFAPDSWADVFVGPAPLVYATLVLDAHGYGTAAVPNPNVGGLAGVTVTVQGLSVTGGALQISSPVLVQLR